MQKFTTLAAIVSLCVLCACTGPSVDKQFANRQIASINIQPGPKLDSTQIFLMKESLQPALVQALKGRGAPPAIDLTFKINFIGFPDGQVIGAEGFMAKIAGPGPQGANIAGTIELWDPSTRTMLTSFGVATRINVRTHSTLGSIFGYPKGYAPQDASDIYTQLSQAIAREITISLYGIK